MPCYNSESYLKYSIGSVLGQSFSDFSLIIIDDGSSDGTLNILNQYLKVDDRVQVFNNEYEKGSAGARNTGLSKVNCSDYIAFIDSDDIWDESKLEKQIKFMSDNDLYFCYTPYSVIDDYGSKIGVFYTKRFFSRKRLLFTCDIGCSTVMISNKIPCSIRFPIINKEDYALWLNISKNINEEKIGVLFEALTLYRKSSCSVSSNKWKEIYRQNEILKSYTDLNLSGRLLSLFLYAIFGLKKHFHNYRVLK